MTTLYQEIYDTFESQLEGGELLVPAHSGVNGQPNTFPTTVRDYYNADEIMCENDWADKVDDEGLPLIVSVEEILDGADLEEVVYNYLHDEFLKFHRDEEGVHTLKRFDEMMVHLSDSDKEHFVIEWLKGEEAEAECMRYCVTKYAVW